jgi:GT2 family glycosyltransferase
MEMLPKDTDWACFLDHDAMFTTDDWHKQLGSIIRKHPKVGAFGARANRVGYSWQLVGNIDIDNNNMQYHRGIGRHMQKTYYHQVSSGSASDKKPSRFSGTLINEPRFSGTLILVKKSTWKSIKGFRGDGFLAVDDDFRKRLLDRNIQFGIMDGVYLYHWYRQDSPYETSTSMLNSVRTSYAEFRKNNEFDLNKITLLE